MLLLGYGCSLDLPHLTIDGLAYLHHTYQGPKNQDKFGAVDEERFGRGDLELIQVRN